MLWEPEATCVFERYACDLCRLRAGFTFIDGYWSCLQCRLRYLRKLEAEQLGVDADELLQRFRRIASALFFAVMGMVHGS